MSVCNDGQRPVAVAVLATAQYLVGPPEAKLSGFFTIEPGKCPNVFDSFALGATIHVNVAIARQNDQGQFVPTRVEFDTQATNRSRYRVEKFCVDSDGIVRNGSFEDLVELTRPPCSNGWWEMETSGTPMAANARVTLRIGSPAGEQALPPPARVLSETRTVALLGGGVFDDLQRYTELSFPEHAASYRRSGGAFTFDGLPGLKEVYAENGGYPRVLTCLYTAPRSGRMYFFWVDGPFVAAQKERLRALHPYTPLLLIGNQRSACPETDAVAHAAVAEGL